MKTFLQTSHSLMAKCMVVVAGLVVAAPALGTTIITTADGSGGDADIRDTAPNTNYDQPYMEVRHNKFAIRHGYLRWDLSSLSGTATSVEMSIMVAFAQNVPANVDIYGLNDGNPGEGWTENTITWNNAPGNDTSGNDPLPAEVTYLGTMTAGVGTAAGNILTFSNAALTNLINADTDNQVTLILVNPDPTGDDTSVQFMRKEDTDTLPSTGLTYAATLTIETVPEPAGIALLSLGLLGALVRRRVILPC